MWGENTWGQIGDGTLTSPQLLPLALGGTGATWKSVAIGGSHTLGIKSDGSLWAWGLNLNGQLGDGTNGIGRYRTAPVQIGTAKDWLAVAAGNFHSLAIQGTSSSNKLMSWGQNSDTQLGLATTLLPTSPVAAGDTADKNVPTQITKISDGGVLTTLPVTGKTWRAISVGDKHNLALRTDGLIYSWGDNSKGQLGQASPGNTALATNITQLGASPTNALAIAAGANHSLAILTDHTLWAWGDNTDGQLGDGTGVTTSVGVQVGTDTNWFAVAGGGRHTLAIKLDRTLWAWGANDYGQLGNGGTTNATTPTQIGTATNWVAVSAGKDHSLAIDAGGKLWIWGRNDQGQLGNGTAGGSPVKTPTLLP